MAASVTDMDAVVASSSSLMSGVTSNVEAAAGDLGRRIRLRLAFGGSFVAVSAAEFGKRRRILFPPG